MYRDIEKESSLYKTLIADGQNGGISGVKLHRNVTPMAKNSLGLSLVPKVLRVSMRAILSKS